MLLKRLDYIVLRTKPDDVKWDGKLVRSTKDITDPRITRYVLEPRHDKQWQEGKNVYDLTWKEPGWCLCIDELYYVDDYLKLEHMTNRALTQGRSKHLTMVCGMQRPVSVTRFALSQSSHIIVFQQDDRDAITIGQAAGGKKLTSEIATLRRHEFVWYFRPERRMWRGRLNPSANTLDGEYIGEEE